MQSSSYSLPTFILAECVLCYLDADNAKNLIGWTSKFFEEVSFLNYEMVNPNDKFGQMMIENLEARGCNLLSIK
jgi:tRNA wybutosine-synthesizing protein 4